MKFSTKEILSAIAYMFILVVPAVICAITIDSLDGDTKDRLTVLGGLLAGFYAPVIGSLTFLVIRRQEETQREFSSFEQAEHLLTAVRQDIEYLLDKLEILIFAEIKTSKLKSVELTLARDFLVRDRNSFTQSDDRLQKLDQRYPNLVQMWFSINKLLSKVDTSKFEASRNELSFLQDKCVAVLSRNTCEALDQIMQHNRGSTVTKYYFLDACNHRNL